MTNAKRHIRRRDATSLSHDFTYAPDKPGRGGDKGSNRVFLLDASNLPNPQVLDAEVSKPRWVTGNDAESLISFDDLKPILRKAIAQTEQITRTG